MPVTQGRRTGASAEEQIGAEDPQRVGNAVQQGMFLLRFARAPRIGKEGQNEIDEGPSRLGFWGAWKISVALSSIRSSQFHFHFYLTLRDDCQKSLKNQTHLWRNTA